FVDRKYREAMGKFIEAAKMGNAEAMTFLGRLYWSMQPRDYERSLFWYKEAAERGDWRAMQSLGAIYDSAENPNRNPSEAERWRLAAPRARQIAEVTVVYDGEPRPDDLVIPASELIVRPAAPSNLQLR